MKKILLATTTLIGAAGLFSGAALAETPKVTIGGYTNFEAGFVSDDGNNNTGTGATHVGERQRPQAFRNDTQVDFRIDGKSDSGLGYGGEIDLLADTTDDSFGRGTNASKTMIYLENASWGRFELGSNVGADGTMKVDAGTIARASGGINGDWSYFANQSDQFLAMGALPLSYGTLNGTTLNATGDHTEENLNKITYYTPRFAGVQVGVSYLPDQTTRGQGSRAAGIAAPAGVDRSQGNAGEAQNIFTGGINYDAKFGDFGFTTAATGEYGRAQSARYENLAAWNAGAKLSYMGWSIAGSYGDWGSSNTLKGENSNDTSYWTAGVAYEFGPFAASVTYLNSQFDCGITTGGTAGSNTANCVGSGENHFHNISTGIDYKLAPGLTPYAEVSFYNMNSKNGVAAGTGVTTASTDNSGYAAIIGTQLNF